MKPPTVSIVLPTYNRESLIGQTIESVRSQTMADWELIIVDDGSTDRSIDVIRGCQDSRIQYHRIDHCGIIGKARNHGISFSTGNYIAFLDSDDLWRPDKLEFQLKLFNQHQEAAFIFSNGEHFGDDRSLPAELENLFVGDAFRPMLIEERFIFFVPSFMFRRNVLERVPAIDERLISGGDIDFFFRISHYFKGIFTNERLVRIRKHAHGTSQGREAGAYIDFLIMLKRFYQEGMLTRQEYHSMSARQYYRLGYTYLRHQDFKGARSAFLEHNLIRPLNFKGWIRLSQAFALHYTR